ncbi:acyl-CoA dehydrogenase C-terminal domain-containing protein, partial [Rhizobiaceae sp. 2RAB30]
LSETTRFLQTALTEGRVEEALAGATPYLRLFAVASGAAYLATGALSDCSPSRVALCRFFAENLAGETASLKERVMIGADSLAAAGAALVAA